MIDFEDTPVPNASIEDIDLSFVKEYTKKLGYGKSPEKYLRENKEFIAGKGKKLEISSAAILLFGKNPERFFPRARIRFVRYEGTKAKVGAEMNVMEDVVFVGRILQVTEQALAFVGSQIKEDIYLGADNRLITTPEYPEFAWKEMIVNAIAHRDYSIKGTDIQIKMFDNRLTVESPGTLPGMVRLNNMRHVHFSRNPKIVQFLHEYGYLQELGEGVDRLFDVMKAAGLPEPEYRVDAFMLYASIYNTQKNENCGGSTTATAPVTTTASSVTTTVSIPSTTTADGPTTTVSRPADTVRATETATVRKTTAITGTPDTTTVSTSTTTVGATTTTVDSAAMTSDNKNAEKKAAKKLAPKDAIKVASKVEAILNFCAQPQSREEIMKHCGLKNKNHFIKAYLRALLKSGALSMTIPDKPNSPNQKYLAVGSSEARAMGAKVMEEGSKG